MNCIRQGVWNNVDEDAAHLTLSKLPDPIAGKCKRPISTNSQGVFF